MCFKLKVSFAFFWVLGLLLLLWFLVFAYINLPWAERPEREGRRSGRWDCSIFPSEFSNCWPRRYPRAPCAYANRVKGRGKWENSLDLAYGLIRQGDASFTKSDDWINVVTKYSYLVQENNKKWFYSALLDFRTQFYEGLDSEGNLISDWLLSQERR